MVDYGKMLRHTVDYEGGLEHLGPRAMNDIANESPMRKIGMENPAEYLRQVLRTEKPHNIALHRTGARGARFGRSPRAGKASPGPVQRDGMPFFGARSGENTSELQSRLPIVI